MRWAIWWIVVYAAYIVAAQAEVWTEAVAGAAIAGIAVAIMARACGVAPWDARVRVGEFKRYARLPMQMAGDAFRVCGAILRAEILRAPLTGFFTRIPFRPAMEGDAFEHGREGLVTYGISAAPNTLVAEVDDRGSLVVHELIATPLQVQSTDWPL